MSWNVGDSKDEFINDSVFDVHTLLDKPMLLWNLLCYYLMHNHLLLFIMVDGEMVYGARW